MEKQIKKFEIIDFHTHPFMNNVTNICYHKNNVKITLETTLATMKNLGVKKICGSVISTAPLDTGETRWERILKHNNEALSLREKYGEFYCPGFHVHPDFVGESKDEIDRMNELGVKLIGELVPYMDGYEKYNSPQLDEIINYAAKKNMVLSLHTTDYEDDLDDFVSNHQDITIVAAHPGEIHSLLRHIRRLKTYSNYYLDISGTGIMRYAMLRRLIDEVGVEKILYGSDYPTCNPAAFLGSVLLDELITDNEREYILNKNAKRILGMNRQSGFVVNRKHPD